MLEGVLKPSLSLGLLFILSCTILINSSVYNIANGTLTNQEKNNYREIAIFKTGVTL
ncbi:hypothetical protein EZS27_013477 [termite gut metagenome]|uniref:Uncharacterized protein n=1 Tax=termite gut metagenome TaxID=433724 RepID=A0A5J4RX46_9ZZZZ